MSYENTDKAQGIAMADAADKMPCNFFDMLFITDESPDIQQVLYLLLQRCSDAPALEVWSWMDQGVCLDPAGMKVVLI